ncbi:holo-[acyl-carrier-protein] synthase [Oxobacter pfennigii]|uniref:Holo-[acyl-carrier-protein] synthase n=1 Tax=Oxobacter pfennigii TaxID=36849 RepID=A0A0P8W490_9CLOT|nr:holo-ACP synthase [Oxobacter pfennigii]KPU43403.1 holo-[acyl-carrier-protein] synthase [Oxobacter pfennigii]
MSIKGTGIDIIEIERIKNAADKNSTFLIKVFTMAEIEYFREKKLSPMNIAGNFAAKEAVLKALGTGLREMGWKDIEIMRDELGKPFVVLCNNALNIAKSRGIDTIHISISHCRDYAVAQAVAEGGV